MLAIESPTASDALELVTFHVGNLLVGVDIRLVEEINRQMVVTPLPHVSTSVLGVMNLRGNVVTVLDLRTILGVVSDAETERSHYVIARLDEERVGLAVDRIADVVHVPADRIESLPANFDAVDTRFLRGVYTMDQELLLILDVEVALSFQSNGNG